MQFVVVTDDGRRRYFYLESVAELYAVIYSGIVIKLEDPNV